MNSRVFVIIFALLVCGEVYSVSLCPAGHVMDWGSRSCWRVSSMILDIRECKTTLPELQVSVQGMLNTLDDIERHMRQLEEERNTRISAITEPNQINGRRKESSKPQSEENPTNHFLMFSDQRELNEQRTESTHHPRLSVATSPLDNEQNTHLFEFTDRNELNEQEPIAQSPKKAVQMREEQSTPIFDFSALNEHVTTGRKDEKSSANKSLEKQNTHSSEFSEQDALNKVQISTEHVNSASDSKEEPKITIRESSDRRRIRQLEFDIGLQKEKNEECAAEVRRLVDNVNLLTEESEHVRNELMSLQDIDQEHFTLLSEQNALLSEQTGELEKAHFLTEQCEASLDEVKGMMEENLNDQIIQREEFINELQTLIEKKDDKIVRQQRVITYLLAKISLQRFDDSSEMDELLSSMGMIEEE